MFKYDLKCRKCGFRIENPKDSDYPIRDGYPRFPNCPKCGEIMVHDVIGLAGKGDYYHISDSLAIHPSQIEEHRKLFPDVNVLPDGRPEFTSVKNRDNYLKKTGFVKRTKGRIVGP